MQNKKISVKRVAVGVLVGFVAVTAFAGVGRMVQTNVLGDMFSRLTAQENCYYDMSGAYVCDDEGNYYDGDPGCYYDMSGAYVCDDGGQDPYYDGGQDPYYDGGQDPYYDDQYGDYSGSDYGYDETYCGEGCWWEYDHCECDAYSCPDTCWWNDSFQGCECPWDDQYYGDDCGEDSYWDEETQACQPVHGSYDWEDCGYNEYYDYNTNSCQSADGPGDCGTDCWMQYDMNGEPYCYCDDYADGYDPNYDPNQCWSETGEYICGEYDEDFNWEYYGDQEEDFNWEYYGEEEEEDAWWEFWGDDDDDWREDQLEDMAEMLEEASYWLEDVYETEEEVDEWLEEILDMQEDWQEDYDDDFEKLTDWQKGIYEDAIAYADTAYAKVSEILGEFDGMKDDVEQTQAAMEQAYQDFASGTTDDSSTFWDAQGSGGHQWTWIWMSKAEMHGRLLYFYEFLIEAGFVQEETGMTADEIGGDFQEAVEQAQEAIAGVQSMLGSELDAMIAEAEADIASGRDAWRALDDIQDFFDDIRDDYLDDDRDMWDSLEEAWELVHMKDMENFKMKELEMIREEIAFAQEEIDKLAEEGYDVSDAQHLIDRGLELLDELEATEDPDDMEDLFDELEELGEKADRLFSELGIDFGPDKRHAYAETIDVNDPDALLGLLGNVPENVLEQVIEMLLSNVNSSQIESFIEYGDKFGDVGFFDSASMAYAEGDKIDEMIEHKLAILEELDAKMGEMEAAIGAMQDKLDKLTDKVAGYNWYGDASEEAQEKIDELQEALGDATSDEEKEEILAEFDEEFNELMEEAKDDKYDDGLIPFLDTDDDQWYTSYVWDVMEAGAVSGYKDADGDLTGYYGPGDNVTIAETLKIALETAGVGDGGGGHPSSNAYAGNHWSNLYFGMAEYLGMSVTQDFTRSPDSFAERGEIIQTMVEALEIDVPDYSSTDFADVDASYPYADAIQYAKQLGIVSGDDETGNFRPYDPVNRAEAAKIVDQFMEVAELEGWI